MSPSLRKIRLRSVWLLVIPFLWWARPTPATLSLGGGLAALGLLIRGLSAGHIRKDRALATSGPYAHTRNPLYLGTLVLGVGVTVAGGKALFVVLFMVFFLVIYARTMRSEARFLEGEFGESYEDYRRRVPVLLPRITPYRTPDRANRGRFSFDQYRRNREYEALLGVLAGFTLLVMRMYWP
jgi:protein-S-isoprenylcysteine O-methyltransferase Ste14